MIPFAILTFLTGAVLAWTYRVWILIPITLATMMAVTAFALTVGAGFLTAVASGFLTALAPQAGYAFGLCARTAVVLARTPRKAAILFAPSKNRSINGL